MRAKRLNAAQKRISRFPYRYHAVDDAYAQFLKDGTLPEDLTLAAAVMHRLLNARRPPKEQEAWRLELIASGALRQPYGSTREMFFSEACSEVKCLRDFARWLLKAVVQAGHDPTDPEMIGFEVEPDNYAPVTLQLLGFPHDYVRPEYQAQLQRVLRQRTEVRAQRPVSEEWDRGARKAVAAFLKHGEIPTDPRYYLHALSVGEMFALNTHYFGRGGEDLLAAYEAVATSTGPQWEAALRHLGELQVKATEAQR